MIFGKVYLAGSISGLDYDTARHGWRKEFAALPPKEILVYSPMRAKEFLSGQENLDEEHFPHPETSPRAILTRDHNDIKNCDVFVANFLGADKVSIGTCVEFGFAFAYMKPVIVIMEIGKLDFGYLNGANSSVRFAHYGNHPQANVVSAARNVHDHPFINAIAGYRVDNLKDAAKIVTSILEPGV